MYSWIILDAKWDVYDKILNMKKTNEQITTFVEKNLWKIVFYGGYPSYRPMVNTLAIDVGGEKVPLKTGGHEAIRS